jgi:hypothetical protein
MYYPKSKIIPNQYTKGDELVYTSNGIYYTGYYHILADNTIYTGKNPNDGISFRLIFPKNTITPIIQGTSNDELESYTFSTTNTDYDSIRTKQNITPPSLFLLEPKYSPPLVKYPSFIRYFVKRTNNNVYIEINKSTYDIISSQDKKWNWAVYFPFNMPWTTSGISRDDVFKTNRDIVLLTEQRLKLYGFSNYITNYTEFYI